MQDTIATGNTHTITNMTVNSPCILVARLLSIHARWSNGSNIHISRKLMLTMSASQEVPLQLSHVVHASKILQVLLSGIHIPTSRASIPDVRALLLSSYFTRSTFRRPRKDRLHARIRVSAQTGQRECMHTRRRKRCDEPFTKRPMAGAIYAASLV
jgi:hypothetical protein